MPPNRARKVARVYVLAVVTIGLTVVGTSIAESLSHPVPITQWLLLAGLTLISGSATVRLPATAASISVSETFVFTAVLLYGPAAGTLLVVLDGLVMSFWIARRIREVMRALFNMSAPAISVWVSAHIFFIHAGIRPLGYSQSNVDTILFPLLTFALTYFGINSSLIATAIAIHSGSSPIKVWKDNFIWVSLNYLCGASVAILLVVYTRTIDVTHLGVILPLLFVLYFTFKTSLGRVEDAIRHVNEVNRLYLSTIETLAMAVDAKDQVTHGHIRRVQRYALGLAKRLGVTDEKLLKAIEAAALLHDMGKLAIPEHILNKPGKLSESEFEKMKQHATIGAELLSAIDFPYPVVPIVRHHHEHWNGHGYPDGLRGIDIPIGARILAVVDCFDALTSDRPYRAKLTSDEAFEILLDRRGTYYDPLVVDAFIECYRELAQEEVTQATGQTALDRTLPSPVFLDRRPGATPIVPAKQLSLSGDHRCMASAQSVVQSIRSRLQCSLAVIYRYDPLTDSLIATYASGPLAERVLGLTIPLGERISGWVAANRMTIMNSDPRLDLGEIVGGQATLLNSLSTPITTCGNLVGVLSLYSDRPEKYTDTHSRLVESLGREAAETLKTVA